MPDWLTAKDTFEPQLTPLVMTARLVAALGLGVVVALVFRVSHGRGKADSPVMVTTLVLLSVLIAMVSMVIGNSVARAFSLVGALSIVRFRTVVDDTRDTAFVIFSVVVGMAVGAGLFLVPLVGVPLVAVGAVALSWWEAAHTAAQADSSVEQFQLVVRLGLGRDPEQSLGATLKQHLRACHLESASTARQGTALDLVYAVRLAEGASLTACVTQLNQVDGVQHVEMRER